MSTAAGSILPSESAGRNLPRWVFAAALVLLFHAGCGYWLMHKLHEEEAVPAGAPPEAVMLELAPLAVAPPVEAPAQEAPTPTTEAQPEEVTPETPPEPTPPEPTPPVPVEPQAVVAPELPPVPKAEVVLPPKPTPKPKPVPVQKVEKPAPPKPVAKKEQHKPVAQKTTAPPRADSHAQAMAAPSPGASGSSMAPSNWKQMVFAALARNKRYPDAERMRGTQGTVSLSFTIDRSGRVVSAHVAGSSGSPALDEAAVAMAERASPLPPPPAEVPGSRINLVLPVRFSIR